MNPFRLEELTAAEIALERHGAELLNDPSAEQRQHYYQAHERYVSARIDYLNRVVLITAVHTILLTAASMVLVQLASPPTAIQWALYIAAASIAAIAGTHAYKLSQVIRHTHTHYTDTINDIEQLHHHLRRNT